MMYKRILLPLDGSSISEQALPHAIAQAKRFNAELIILRVVEPLGERVQKYSTSIERVEKEMLDFVLESLKKVAIDVRAQGVKVRTEALQGRPHVKIIEYAESEEVDLVVICSRGKTGFSRWLMGSVADRVIRGVRTPVLVVRAQKPEFYN
jgi:nucleotide-binding universal stress UspA family protein